MKKTIIGICLALTLIGFAAFAEDASKAPAAPPAAPVAAPAAPAAPTPSAAPAQPAEAPKQPVLDGKEAPKQVELSPVQALEYLARAASEYRGTLEEHMVLRQSVVTLAKALGLDKLPSAAPAEKPAGK